MALTVTGEQLSLQPQIVASFIVGGKAAVIGSTILLASAPPGIYRATAVQIITTGGTSGALTTNVIATDDFQANTLAVCTVASVATTGQVNGTQVFENTATANINFSVVAGGTFGACVYSLYLILERLF